MAVRRNTGCSELLPHRFGVQYTAAPTVMV
jgi:hypothetical protein